MIKPTYRIGFFDSGYKTIITKNNFRELRLNIQALRIQGVIYWILGVKLHLSAIGSPGFVLANLKKITFATSAITLSKPLTFFYMEDMVMRESSPIIESSNRFDFNKIIGFSICVFCVIQLGSINGNNTKCEIKKATDFGLDELITSILIRMKR